MSKYLLASDFDGTLVHWPNPSVTEYDRKAIRRFREAGNKFVVITGRRPNDAIAGLEHVGFSDVDAILSLSGAYCMKPDGTEIYDKRSDNVHGMDFINFFIDTQPRYLIADIGRTPYIVDIAETLSGITIISAKEASEIKTFTSYNAIYQSPERATEICEMLTKRFGDMITPLQNGACIDMPSSGHNKAVGAKTAADIFGIEETNIYTVGDSYNDLNMIETYHGSAMQSAPDVVKSKAERTVEQVGEIIGCIMGGN